MSKILRRGEIDSDDEYSDTEETPEIQPVAPEISPAVEFKPSRKAPKAKIEPKIPKIHVCPHCSETFARNASLVRHIDDMRCTVSRRATIDREKEFDMRERRLRDLENEISNKILKSQEKVKKERKPRVAKPKAPPNSPVQPVQQQQQYQQPQIQQRKRPIVNF
jgi:hypothetical protein